MEGVRAKVVRQTDLLGKFKSSRDEEKALKNNGQGPLAIFRESTNVRH